MVTGTKPGRIPVEVRLAVPVTLAASISASIPASHHPACQFQPTVKPPSGPLTHIGTPMLGVSCGMPNGATMPPLSVSVPLNVASRDMKPPPALMPTYHPFQFEYAGAAIGRTGSSAASAGTAPTSAASESVP